MRILTALTVAMGVLILLGTTVLVVALVKRPGPQSGIGSFAVTLSEPTGSRIADLTAVADELAIQLRGGGPDRVVLVDPRSGEVRGRIAVAE